MENQTTTKHAEFLKLHTGQSNETCGAPMLASFIYDTSNWPDRLVRMQLGDKASPPRSHQQPNQTPDSKL
ncbi:hypothetical protein QQZ08_005202 [Neonectria magnoliae]|uniref:Uncharacterized protein n=1 Tax=Neonectria magnoliae TaxID=2732573 RepID=A0ABR1I4A5_9HYPO